MFKKLRNFIIRKSNQIDRIESLIKPPLDIKSHKVNLGQIQAHLNNNRSSIHSLQEVEFQVFSQWGDDGIIQYLVNKIEIPNKIFIEFGVEDYKESNTRFLLVNNNWSGLVIDGTKQNIDFIKTDRISGMFDLHATHAFITKENINDLLSAFLAQGYSNEIGILSIDIDGNDYWVWNEITAVNPIIVIVEYNAVFGNENLWTIPYAPNFYRLDYHKSRQYWGASLAALVYLADKKGYYFVGCNSSGNNSYFIRKDKIGSFKPLSAKEGFVESKFREYKNPQGERVGGPARLDLIKGMPIHNIATNQVEKI